MNKLHSICMSIWDILANVIWHVKMPCFSLCVTTMMMEKLQPSSCATYVEICALTVTDSFIFIGEPRLIKDRCRLLSVHAEQFLERRIHSVNFKINVGRRLAVMGRKGLCSQSLSGVPSRLIYHCVNQDSRLTWDLVSTFIKMGSLSRFRTRLQMSEILRVLSK